MFNIIKARLERNKMGYKKIIIAFISMLALLIGCKGEPSGTTIQPTEQEQPLNTNEQQNTSIHPGLAKYGQDISITFLRELTSSYLDLIEVLPDETTDHNRWTKLYRDQLGVHVKYEWTSEGTFYNQQLNYAIASGNINDVIRVNAEQLRLLNRAGQIQDLTEVFENYATPFTKTILAEDAIDTFEAATIEGRLMGLPEPDFPIERANFIWIRTDWLDELGLAPPQTIEEVNAIALAFTMRDPDQNGINDTYGIAATSYLWDPVMGLQAYMAGYNAFPELWIKDESGQLVYGGIQPEVKKALIQLQQLYKDGIIDQEFSLKNGLRVKESIQNNKIGMFYGEQWGAFIAQTSREVAEDSDWKAYPIVGEQAGQVLVPLKFSPNVFYVVRKDYPNPEALMKMFNLHLEKNWGENADYETYYSNPYPVWQLSPVTPYPARKNFDAYLQLAEARKTNNFSALNPEAKNINKLIDNYLNDGPDKNSGWGWNKIYGEQGAFSILDQYIKRDQLQYDEFMGTRTETMIQVNSILNDLQHQTYINIILGDSIEQFDHFVQKWHDLGGKQMTEEVNEWYSSKQD